MALSTLSTEMMMGRKVIPKRAMVTHRPEVEMLSIRFAHVMKHITRTNPMGRLSQLVASMRVAVNLSKKEASSGASMPLLNNRWTPNTKSPRMYIPRKASVLGLASPFSRMSSPLMRRYLSRLLFEGAASSFTSSAGSSAISSTFSSSLMARPHVTLLRCESNNFPRYGTIFSV